jgi:branched-chain amino acid transport system permease protein
MGQTIINGLLIGGVYALIAVGLSLIHGVMKIVNFAQGDFLAVGMYFSYLLYLLMPEGSLPYWLLIPVAVFMYIFGAIVYRTSVSKVVGKGDSNYILLTLGLSYLIQNVLQLIFGPNYLSVEVSKELKYGAITFGDNLVLMTPRLIAFGGALIFVFLVSYFLSSTDLGRAMRSTSEDSTVAAMLGVNTRAVYTMAFGLGTVFAGIAGLLLTPMFLISPQVGTTFSTIGLSAIVLGGLGNLRGAMVGGLIIGLVESFTTNYASLDLAPVAINSVLMLVLVLKPYGLFGRSARKA